jgi:hypothetical protein
MDGVNGRHIIDRSRYFCSERTALGDDAEIVQRGNPTLGLGDVVAMIIDFADCSNTGSTCVPPRP